MGEATCDNDNVFGLAPNSKALNESAKKRINQYTQTAGIAYDLLYTELTIYNSKKGLCSFNDKEVHSVLERSGIRKKIFNTENKANEWFITDLETVKRAIAAVKEGRESLSSTEVSHDQTPIVFRPEQQEAIEKTKKQFRKSNQMLWNAKMRFGKTFTSYEFAKAQGYQRVLVLTFKPAVENSWREDLESHKDFEGWQFISRETTQNGGLDYEHADKSRPIVCFGSFQDYLGKNEAGDIKAQNEWVHEINWDLVIFDEYYFGAWRDSARELFEQEDKCEQNDNMNSVAQLIDESFEQGDTDFLPITTGAYLFLSGTSFRAIVNGEFIEEQIFNWTYSDEQRAKENWDGAADNPYAALPRMVMMTYRIPDSIRQIAMQGEFNEFDLNVFFSAKGKGEDARFVYENEVQKWLDLIRGAYLETSVDDLKLGAKKPAMPYADVRLLNVLQHTLWFLPNVASCYAMKNLLMQKQNTFYHDYTINVCAGTGAGAYTYPRT